MNEETQKLIDQRIAMLPENIRESLKKIPWAEEILAIGKKNGLHVDQMGELQIETVLVLVGLTHPNQYPTELKRALSLGDAQVTAIVVDVNERILKSIRQSLIDFMALEDATTSTTESQTDTQQTDPLTSAGLEIIPDSSPLENSKEDQIQGGDYEKNMLQKSGVNIEETVTPTEAVVSEGRNDLLDTLEHPPKTALTGFSKFVETQRTQPVVAPAQKTSYKEPEAPKTAPPTAKGDPYREPI